MSKETQEKAEKVRLSRAITKSNIPKTDQIQLIRLLFGETLTQQLQNIQSTLQGTIEHKIYKSTKRGETFSVSALADRMGIKSSSVSLTLGKLCNDVDFKRVCFGYYKRLV